MLESRDHTWKLICYFVTSTLLFLLYSCSQYTIHHTKLRESLSGFLECNVRKKEQIRTTITDLGTQDMRIMYSPGFVLNLEYEKHNNNTPHNTLALVIED